MNYAQTVDYLYSQLPMFSKVGSEAIKKDLTNIRLLCEYLHHPEQQFPSIHIAGTNGKGSVSHMLASVLQDAGYKTGLYTSPHLFDFRERIKIDGEMVTEDFVVDFVASMQDAIARVQPSFFEITVAMAFEWFRLQKVDVAIIETGLGGRLDSTNIIDPVLSVITQIGYDHMQILGNTLDDIAMEKAGIIKPGRPAVIGEKQQDIATVFIRKAADTGSALYWAEDSWKLVQHQWTSNLLELTLENAQQQRYHYKLDLPGIYQLKNVVTVRAAIDVLQHLGWKINEHAIETGLLHAAQKTGLHGRWEQISSAPDIILEVAHNKNGMEAMLAAMQQKYFETLHIVIGMVKDKDVDEVLRLLPVEACYYFTQAHIPRAMDAELLQEKARQHQLSGEVYGHVNEALHGAIQQANRNDLIIVCGSIFLVAEVNKALIRQKAQVL